jgi:hypothetical protein
MEGTDLEKLVIRLVGDGSAYQQMLSMATDATRRFASTTGSILASAGLSFGLLATAIKSVQLAGQFESMQVDLEVLSGSADKAKDLMEELSDFAARTPLELPGLVSSAQRLLQFGIEVDQIVPLLEVLGNAAGGVQGKLDQLSLAFGHAASQGRLTGYSMRQMIFAGFNPLKEIHAMTGRSMPELTEALHKGKIGVDLLVAALENASKPGGTFDQRMAKRATTLPGLFSTMKDNIGFVMRDIGDIIIEGLDLKGAEKKISDAAILINGWLRSITPESKRVIGVILAVVAGIGALSFAMIALGPVISLIGTVLGPVISLLGVIPGLIGFLLSPIGLVVLAIGGLVAAFIYFTDSGGAMVDWFGQALATLKDFFMPAIQGIKDALAAGDITLAFEILWAQIKLTFFQGIKPLRDAWIDYTFFFKYIWTQTVAGVQSAWTMATSYMAKELTWLGNKVGLFTDEQAAAMQKSLTEDMNRDLKKIDKDRSASISSALADANKANQEANSQLTDLYKKRDELAAKAAKEAAEVKTPVVVKPKLKIPPVPDQKMKVVPEVKWEAALAEGAEAVSRMIAYGMNLAGLGPGLGAHGGHGAGGVGGAGGMGEGMGGGMGAEGDFGEGPNPIQAGGMEDDPARDKMVALLGEVANNTGTMAKKPGLNVVSANLA